MTEREIIEHARKKVKAKKDFYGHLISYGIVISFLFIINLITSPSYFWFIFPALGWGIGLAFHYFAVFGLLSEDTGDWEKKELEKEINKLKRSGKYKPDEEDTLNLNEEKMELKELKEELREWDDRDLV